MKGGAQARRYVNIDKNKESWEQMFVIAEIIEEFGRACRKRESRVVGEIKERNGYQREQVIEELEEERSRSLRK
jgi:hypothetical protein